MDQIDSNGVRFTPTKTVNLDELEERLKEKKEEEVDDKSDEVKDKSDEVQSDNTDTTTESPDNGDEGKQKETVTETQPDKISLDEIVLNDGSEEISATEFVKRYEETKGRLQKIEGDEFLGKFVEYYLDGGNPTEFLSKATMKWDEVDDVQVLRRKFDAENSDIDADLRDLMFDKELKNKYSVGSDGEYDEEDKESKLGRQLMRRDASKLRAEFIDEQKKYLLPKDKTNEPTYDPKQVADQLMKDQELSDVVNKKIIPVGESFNYEIKDTEKLIGMMADVSQFWKLFDKGNGQFDKAKVAKVFAFALDPDRYDSSIIGLGKGEGAEGYIKEQKNIVSKGTTNVDKTTDSNNETRVVNGRIVSSNKDDLLSAFVSSKKKK